MGRNELLHLKNILVDKKQPVLMQSEFNSIIQENKKSSTSIRNIKNNLIEMGTIKKIILRSDGYKDVERIIIPLLNPTPYHYATSLRKGAYLSHSSSMNILGLTQQIPKIIYVNKEQSPKNKSKDPLNQESIDRAFKNQQRKSKYIFKIEEYQIILLSGKSTNNAGVVIDNYLGIPLTCLERTLIDITVRPKYAGGVFNVLEAFKNSISNIDFEKILNILKKLDYKYPYHQSLGFYLERAGANSEILKKFSEFGIDFNFYLDYSMTSTKLDKSWRVYFPLGI